MPMDRREMRQRLLDFLSRKYVQHQDARTRAMGLRYMMAETHDLATELSRFIERDLMREQHSVIQEGASADA